MSNLSVFAAAALGGALAALHINTKQSAEAQLKAVAQKQLNAYKPVAIDLVKKYADRLESSVVSQTDVSHLLASLFVEIDKTSLPDLAKTALKMAVVQGVTETNTSALTGKGLSLLAVARDKIIREIQGAHL